MPLDLSEIYHRFLRNAGMILGSRVVFGLLNLATTVIATRAFGLAELGIVLLLQSYARLAGELVRFESWQTVLRFGAIAEETRDSGAFRRLIGLTLSIDIASLAVSVTGAILLVPVMQQWLEWPEDVAALAPLFVFSMIFFIHATPNGVLRHFDRIGIVALQYAANAVLRFTGVAAAALLGVDGMYLVHVWFAASVLSGSIIFVAAFAELWRRRLMPRLTLRWRIRAREFPGIWRFLWLSNLISSLPLVINYGSTLLVGGVLGPAPAAIFDIARQLARSLSHPAKLLGPLILPDFSRLAARGDWTAMRHILGRQLRLTGFALAMFALLLGVLLPWLIDLLYGPEAAAEISLFRLMLLGAMLRFLGFAIEPAFLSADKVGTAFLIEFAAVVLYVAIAVPGLHLYGLTAMGVATLGFYTLYLSLLLVIGRRLLDRRIRRAAAAAAQPPRGHL